MSEHFDFALSSTDVCSCGFQYSDHKSKFSLGDPFRIVLSPNREVTRTQCNCPGCGCILCLYLFKWISADVNYFLTMKMFSSLKFLAPGDFELLILNSDKAVFLDSPPKEVFPVKLSPKLES